MSCCSYKLSYVKLRILRKSIEYYEFENVKILKKYFKINQYLMLPTLQSLAIGKPLLAINEVDSPKSKKLVGFYLTQ